MMRRLRVSLLAVLALGVFVPWDGRAQQAMTVTGHVSAADQPVRGATVRIDELDLGATTNSDGRYSFIIPSTRVRGQRVALSVSFSRFRKQSIDVELTGTSLVRDFALRAESSPSVAAATPDTPAGTARVSDALRTGDAPGTGLGTISSGATRIPAKEAPLVDSTAFTETAGLVDLASSLAGRVAGLDVQTSSALGGTSAMVVRGRHSIVGLTDPLLVVDGVFADNSNLAALLQRNGLGGFDYGTTIGDLNLEDIASVRLIDGPAAAARFGGRGANGALIVTTRSARGLNGFEVSATQQITTASLITLPKYQDSYGQGLKGTFGFFDGKGGGINDATDQSWGPALSGTPTLQASLTEAGRADVRAFVPSPDNVHGYFQTGRTFATTVALQGGGATGHYRASFSNRLNSGITPGTSVTRRSGVFAGEAQASERLSVSGTAQVFDNRGEDRPGSGADESNTVSTFAHMPRQVDLTIYKARLRDASGAQLSWNYAGRNNPWFASLENDNHDNRTRVLGGASATYSLNSWLGLSAHAGTDRSSETRTFAVASGWMGGYPYYRGVGDFSSGGFENDDISRSATSVDALFTATPRMSGMMRLTLSAGAAHQGDKLTMVMSGADKPASTSTPAPLDWTGDVSSNALLANADVSIGEALSLSASLRRETVSSVVDAQASTTYPALSASVDLLRLRPRTGTHLLESVVLRGGWSRSGNSVTSAELQRLGFASGSAAALLPATVLPEITQGWEGGAQASLASHRVTLDAALYSERSTNLFLPDATFSRTGVVTNAGAEGTVNVVPLRTTDGLEWNVGVNVGVNRNRVEAISESTTSVSLAPAIGGLSIIARPGYSAGALSGTRFLRNASGQLLLQNGHPLPDSVAGPVVLGSSAPDWTGGLSSSLKRGIFVLSVLLDARHGGSVFSNSNRVGAISGVLEETSFRPDSGYLVSGVDVTGNKPNTTHVSAEDYYHSLGAIAERWVYDASYVKLREARLAITLPLAFLPAVRTQSFRLAIIGRNLRTWSNVPNVDPETLLSTSGYQGAELGQLPTARSVGVQLSLTP